MSKQSLCKLPVRGVPNSIGPALARAFAQEMFLQVSQHNPMNSIRLQSERGYTQVLVAHGHWVVCGSYWGLKNPPKRIIDTAYRYLRGKGISRESIEIAMKAAYQADARWTLEHPLVDSDRMIIRPKQKRVTAG